MIHSFYWTWKWLETQYLFPDIGARREDIFNTREVFIKFHLNFQISLRQLAFPKWENRQVTKTKVWNKRCVNECNPRWVRSILIIRSFMMLFSKTRKNRSLLITGTYTLKVKSMKSGWEVTSRVECHLNWDWPLVSLRIHHLHGLWTCRDMDLLLHILILKFQQLMHQSLNRLPMAMDVFSLMKRALQYMLIVMVLISRFTKEGKIENLIGVKLRTQSRRRKKRRKRRMKSLRKKRLRIMNNPNMKVLEGTIFLTLMLKNSKGI